MLEHIERFAERVFRVEIREPQPGSQMLFGVRRDLQLHLVQDGFQVRVYLPYGEEWYPYLVRRLVERPANIGFFVRSLLAEALEGWRNGRP